MIIVCDRFYLLWDHIHTHCLDVTAFLMRIHLGCFVFSFLVDAAAQMVWKWKYFMGIYKRTVVFIIIKNSFVYTGTVIKICISYNKMQWSGK